MNYVDRNDGWTSGFTKAQLRKLVREVDAHHTHTRDFDGRKLTYIEGWYAIAQANEIFGYAGWDREMVHFERIMERSRGDTVTCGYIARVRIRVRAGSAEIVREGTGWGSASATAAATANERALKAAETDATKRALSTFGPSFGLSLYDKDRVAANQRPTFILYTPDGRPLANGLSAEAYCSGLRQLIDICRDVREVDELSRHNRSSLSDLRVYVPSLRNDQGTHFATLLLRLLRRRRERLAPAPVKEGRDEPAAAIGESPAPPSVAVTNDVVDARKQVAGTVAINVAVEASKVRPGTVMDGLVATARDGAPGQRPEALTISNPSPTNGAASEAIRDEQKSSLADGTNYMPNVGPSHGDSTQTNSVGKIDKSQLPLGLERRLRDRNHLKRVAELPCLVCSRQPSHAHHLRFAQRRGLSQKVSDEYVVPLCALHHGDLHRHASERQWWELQKLDPLPLAKELWGKHRSS